MRDLYTKHRTEINKPLEFIELKLKAFDLQKIAIGPMSNLNENGLLASYRVASCR